MMTPEQLSRLDTEKVNPASLELDQMDSLSMVQLINREDQHVIAAVQRELVHIAQAIDLICARMQQGGRLIYIGAGTSGRLGVLDASECLPTFGMSPDVIVGLIAGGDRALRHAIEGAEDRPELGADALRTRDLGPADAVVGIAASGRTPFVLGALGHAREVGAATIGLCCVSASELAAHCDVCIAPVTGPEVLTGSTRMKAGSAQKMVLNMLSTCSLVKQGKVYGHWMVDVRAANEKLMVRSVSMVCQATGVDAAVARSTLQACRGNVKQALVVLLAKVSPEQARARLAQAQGRVRAAINQVSSV